MNFRSKWYQRNSQQPLHDVTHRQIGDIPGCTPAPRDGIFKPLLHADAEAANLLRAARFAHALDTDQFGASFRGRDFAEPIFGAFGEKL